MVLKLPFKFMKSIYILYSFLIVLILKLSILTSNVDFALLIEWKISEKKHNHQITFKSQKFKIYLSELLISFSLVCYLLCICSIISVVFS